MSLLFLLSLEHYKLTIGELHMIDNNKVEQKPQIRFLESSIWEVAQPC